MGWILGESVEDELFEAVAEIRSPVVARAWDWAVQVVFPDLFHCRGGEQRTACHQHVGHRRQGVNVAGNVAVPWMADGFWGHVEWGAEESGGGLALFPGRFRNVRMGRGLTDQSEIEDLQRVGHAAAFAEEEISGLDVPMNQTDPMGFPQRFSRLPEQVDDPGFGLGTMMVDQILESEPLEQLHGVIEDPVGRVAVVEDLDGVGVRQPAGQLHLVFELPDEVVVGSVRQQQLHSRLAPKQGVSGPVHRSHGPFADLGDQGVLAQLAGTQLRLVEAAAPDGAEVDGDQSQHSGQKDQQDENPEDPSQHTQRLEGLGGVDLGDHTELVLIDPMPGPHDGHPSIVAFGQHLDPIALGQCAGYQRHQRSLSPMGLGPVETLGQIATGIPQHEVQRRAGLRRVGEYSQLSELVVEAALRQQPAFVIECKSLAAGSRAGHGEYSRELVLGTQGHRQDPADVSLGVAHRDEDLHHLEFAPRRAVRSRTQAPVRAPVGPSVVGAIGSSCAVPRPRAVGRSPERAGVIRSAAARRSVQAASPGAHRLERGDQGGMPIGEHALEKLQMIGGHHAAGPYAKPTKCRHHAALRSHQDCSGVTGQQQALIQGADQRRHYRIGVGRLESARSGTRAEAGRRGIGARTLQQCLSRFTDRRVGGQQACCSHLPLDPNRERRDVGLDRGAEFTAQSALDGALDGVLAPNTDQQNDRGGSQRAPEHGPETAEGQAASGGCR